jgi:hypothetical protein
VSMREFLAARESRAFQLWRDTGRRWWRYREHGWLYLEPMPKGYWAYWTSGRDCHDLYLGAAYMIPLTYTGARVLGEEVFETRRFAIPLRQEAAEGKYQDLIQAICATMRKEGP